MLQGLLRTVVPVLLGKKLLEQWRVAAPVVLGKKQLEQWAAAAVLSVKKQLEC